MTKDSLAAPVVFTRATDMKKLPWSHQDSLRKGLRNQRSEILESGDLGLMTSEVSHLCQQVLLRENWTQKAKSKKIRS